MRKVLLVALMLLAAAPSMAATAAAKGKSSVKGGKPYFEASEKTTAQATVLSVNKSNRKVKLLTEQGDTISVKAGPEVKNFAQIMKGDVVKVSYTEHLTVHVEPAGAAESTEETSTAAAKPGAKPSASMTSKVQYKATITAIDKEKGTVTLKGHDGLEFDIMPRHPENLDKVKVGELVVFTYTESVAASVEKVSSTK